ncbi:MAG: hypothetical protein ACOYK9_01060 [Chlamydiia bacterium]
MHSVNNLSHQEWLCQPPEMELIRKINNTVFLLKMKIAQFDGNYPVIDKNFKNFIKEWGRFDGEKSLTPDLKEKISKLNGEPLFTSVRELAESYIFSLSIFTREYEAVKGFVDLCNGLQETLSTLS